MQTQSALLTALLACALSAPLAAQTKADFADPVRLQAGEDFVGAQRLYPSPMLQDVTGDGLADVVVGDLFGRLTFAPRLASEDGAIAFGPEQPMKRADGEDLKFNNW